jgi:membrane protein YqaA with SNARE-associated domain
VSCGSLALLGPGGQYVPSVTSGLLAMFGIYGGTFVLSVLAGLFPLINTEVYLIGLVRFGLSSSSQLAPVVIAASTGQMVAKCILYYTGRSLIEVPRGRYQKKIELLRAKIERWQHKPYLIYAISSVLGIPPLYLTVLAAGAMRLRFDAFLIIGLLGRHIRFAVIVGLAWVA